MTESIQSDRSHKSSVKQAIFKSFSAGSLVLIICALLRIILVFNQEPGFGGDSGWFLEKSAYIIKHQELPPAGNKPYGFSLYLAALALSGVDDVVSFQTRLQAIMDLLVVGVLLLFVYAAPAPVKWQKNLMSVFILLQPFTVTFAHVLLVEQLLSFILFLSCLLFGAGCILLKSHLGQLLLIAFAFLLGLSALLRSEMIAVVALGLPLTVFLVNRRISVLQNLKMTILLGVLAATPFLIYTAAQYNASQQLQFSNANYGWGGYHAWLRTWVVLEKSQHNKFGFGVGSANWAGRDMNNYPKRAFDSQAEQAKVAELTEKVLITGFTPDLDNEFQFLANEKTKTEPIRTFVLLPLARGVHYFVNLEGGEFYLRGPWLPKPMRYLVILFLFAMKMLFIALAMYGAFLLLFRSQQLNFKILPFAMFAAVFVFIRWSLLVVLSPFLFAGLMESRYVYVLWPLILLLAIVPFWRFHRVSPSDGKADFT